MLEKYHKLQPKPKTPDELKATLQTFWEKLPLKHVNNAVANFTKPTWLWLPMVIIRVFNIFYKTRTALMKFGTPFPE